MATPGNPVAPAPAVSVVIPVYNVEPYLRACLDSIVGQTLADLEILCVDDGSTDGSSAILEEYARRDPRLVVLRQENRGQATARNAGIGRARGKYLYFMDADDVLERHALEVLLREAERDGLDLLLFDGDAFYETKELEREYQKDLAYYSRKREYGDVRAGRLMFADMRMNGDYRSSPCLQFIRRGYLGDLGLKFHDGIVHEDQLFSFLCILQAGRVRHVQQVLFHRRLRAGSTMTRRPDFENCRGCYTAFIHMMQFALDHSEEAAVAEAMAKELQGVYRIARNIYLNLPPEEKQRTRPMENLLVGILGLDELNAMKDKLAAARKQLAETGGKLDVSRKMLAETRRKLEATREILAETQQSLSFRLGTKITYLPYKIFAGITGGPPRKAKNAAFAKTKKNVLWHAQQMLDDQLPVAEILSFVESTPNEAERRAAGILRANLELDDEAAWLRHLNGYVAQFGIAPVELLPEGPARFHRLAARPARRVETGPLVSVIMPAFNAERLLECAARSILAQTWRPLELIIVDDCSVDGTWAIAQRLAREDARVKLLRNALNVGCYVSKNIALQHAAGAYVTGHDSDDWAHPERIERQVGAMIQAGGAVQATMTNMIRMEESGRFCRFITIGKTSFDGVARIASISCMFEAAAFRKTLGHWDSVRFGADSELIDRARIAFGAGFVELRQLGMICLDRDESLTNHPEHGISRITGLSDTRRAYLEEWEAWHRGLTPAEAHLPFPQRERRFAAPSPAVVAEEVILQVLHSHPAPPHA